MPLINVKLIEDVFTPDQKREIVERLTDAMVSIEGENMRSVTWVVVEEVASGDWGTRGWRGRVAPAADRPPLNQSDGRRRSRSCRSARGA